MIKLHSIDGFIETWHENTTTSTCSECQNIFRVNLNAQVNLLALNRFLLVGLFIWCKLGQCNYIRGIVKAKLK